MSPRKDGETASADMMVDNNVPTSGCPKEEISLGKSLKVFGVLPMSDIDVCRIALSASLKSISNRAAALQNRVEESLRLSSNSSVVKACQFSLCSDFSSMLKESKTLLENLGSGHIKGFTIAPWRVSVSQLRAESYLDTIEEAFDHSSREILDSELRATLESVTTEDSSNLSNEEKHDDKSSRSLRLSPWTLPILAFDVSVGDSVSHDLPGNKPYSNELPMKINVSAIVELSAIDILNGRTTKSARTCQVQIERCVHGAHKHGTGAGIVGDAWVHVKLSSFDDEEDKCNDSKTWQDGKILQQPMDVKEARCVQVNAFPPQPIASVDLFTSTVYGESGIGISLCFETLQTLNNDVPVMNIELVVN